MREHEPGHEHDHETAEVDPGPEVDPKAPTLRAEGIIAGALLVATIGVGTYHYTVQRHLVPPARVMAGMEGSVGVDRGVYGTVLIGTGEADGAKEIDEAIAAAPAAETGRSVKLRGRVDRVLSDYAFVLRRGDLSGAELVVLAPSFPDRDITLARGDDVVVQGTLQRLDPAAVSEQGGLDLSTDELAKLSGKPVLWAGGAVAH